MKHKNFLLGMIRERIGSKMKIYTIYTLYLNRNLKKHQDKINAMLPTKTTDSKVK